MKLETLPHISADGTAYEVGRTIGQAGKSQIIDQIESTQTAANRSESTEFQEKRNRYRDAMCEYLGKHFSNELAMAQGMADGAECDSDDVLMLSLSPSIGELVSRPVPHHCSSIAWCDGNGNTYLFKTDDGFPVPDEQPVEEALAERLTAKAIFDLKIDGQHATVGANDFGRVFIEVGLNEVGLCMGHSSGRPVLGPQDGVGIPQHMFPGMVLRYCSTCEEAVEFAKAHPVAGKGVNIALADPSGRMVAIEKCGNLTGVRWGESYIYTVNHYLDQSMWDETCRQLPDFEGGKYHQNSDERRQFIDHVIPSVVQSQSDIDAAHPVLTADEPGNISQRATVSVGGMFTQFAMAMHAQSRSVRVYIGPPHWNRFYEYAANRA